MSAINNIILCKGDYILTVGSNKLQCVMETLNNCSLVGNGQELVFISNRVSYDQL